MYIIYILMYIKLTKAKRRSVYAQTRICKYISNICISICIYFTIVYMYICVCVCKFKEAKGRAKKKNKEQSGGEMPEWCLSRHHFFLVLLHYNSIYLSFSIFSSSSQSLSNHPLCDWMPVRSRRWTTYWSSTDLISW